MREATVGPDGAQMRWVEIAGAEPARVCVHGAGAQAAANSPLRRCRRGVRSRSPDRTPRLHFQDFLMNDLNVIDRFLQTFIRYIDSGFGLLGGDVAFLTTTLIGSP